MMNRQQTKNNQPSKGGFINRLVRRIIGIEDYIIEDYELETLKKIRKKSFELKFWSTKALCCAYRQYSDDFYCAGWISENEQIIESFIKWTANTKY